MGQKRKFDEAASRCPLLTHSGHWPEAHQRPLLTLCTHAAPKSDAWLLVYEGGEFEAHAFGNDVDTSFRPMSVHRPVGSRLALQILAQINDRHGGPTQLRSE